MTINILPNKYTREYVREVLSEAKHLSLMVQLSEAGVRPDCRSGFKSLSRCCSRVLFYHPLRDRY
ncbi:MAG: hypothetical protein ACOCSC_03340, partial [Candidatus Hadarchaeota archaeon]